MYETYSAVQGHTGGHFEFSDRIHRRRAKRAVADQNEKHSRYFRDKFLLLEWVPVNRYIACDFGSEFDFVDSEAYLPRQDDQVIEGNPFWYSTIP